MVQWNGWARKPLEIIIIILFFCSPVMGATIPYSGTLKDLERNSMPEGSYDFSFSLYDSNLNGKSLWSETQMGLYVQAGQFATLLGIKTPLPDQLIKNSNLWLAIGIKKTEDKNFSVLSPRQQLIKPSPLAQNLQNGLSCPHNHWEESWVGGTDASGFSVTNSGAGNGLAGYNHSSGMDRAALLGRNDSNGIAVWGDNTGGGWGVIGNSVGNIGVRGVGGSVGVEGLGTGDYGSGVTGEGKYIGVIGRGPVADFYAGFSGTYAPFTGSHEVKISSAEALTIKRGMIVSSTGKIEGRKYKNGDPHVSSVLPTVELSSRESDPNVFGVVSEFFDLPKTHWYQPESGDRFALVNALGEGRVWVSDINGNIKVGDYITTSLIPGFGMRQADDLLHNYTLGKAIEGVDWETVQETILFNGRTIKIYLIGVVYTSG